MPFAIPQTNSTAKQAPQKGDSLSRLTNAIGGEAKEVKKLLNFYLSRGQQTDVKNPDRRSKRSEFFSNEPYEKISRECAEESPAVDSDGEVSIDGDGPGVFPVIIERRISETSENSGIECVQPNSPDVPDDVLDGFPIFSAYLPCSAKEESIRIDNDCETRVKSILGQISVDAKKLSETASSTFPIVNTEKSTIIFPEHLFANEKIKSSISSFLYFLLCRSVKFLGRMNAESESETDDNLWRLMVVCKYCSREHDSFRSVADFCSRFSCSQIYKHFVVCKQCPRVCLEEASRLKNTHLHDRYERGILNEEICLQQIWTSLSETIRIREDRSPMKSSKVDVAKFSQKEKEQKMKVEERTAQHDQQLLEESSSGSSAENPTTKLSNSAISSPVASRIIKYENNRALAESDPIQTSKRYHQPSLRITRGNALLATKVSKKRSYEEIEGESMPRSSDHLHEDKWHCEYCNNIPPIFQVEGGSIRSEPGRSKHLKECNGGRPSLTALVQICNSLSMTHPSFSPKALTSVPFIKFVNSIVGKNLVLTSLFTLDVAVSSAYYPMSLFIFNS